MCMNIEVTLCYTFESVEIGRHIRNFVLKQFTILWTSCRINNNHVSFETCCLWNVSLYRRSPCYERLHAHGQCRLHCRLWIPRNCSILLSYIFDMQESFISEKKKNRRIDQGIKRAFFQNIWILVNWIIIIHNLTLTLSVAFRWQVFADISTS